MRWVDRFLGFDPGLNRLRSAVLSVLTIGVILEVEWLLVHVTHALQVQASGAQATEVALADHEYLVTAVLLGAIIGMISSFAVMDPTTRGQLVTMLSLPVPMVPALALGIAMGSYRILALVLLPVVLPWSSCPAPPGGRPGPWHLPPALRPAGHGRLHQRSGIVGKGELAIRDLKLVDDAMAAMAEVTGLGVTDYDTVVVGRSG